MKTRIMLVRLGSVALGLHLTSTGQAQCRYKATFQAPGIHSGTRGCTESSCSPRRYGGLAFIALTGSPSSAEATDPRGKVHGLMGLSNSEEPFYQAIDVNYGKSVGQLFVDVALSAVKATDSLDVL